MSYLSDLKEFDGGYVTFGGGAKGGKITSKGTLKTGKLDFEDVYFVKELQFNLFSVSQMCDKKNSVLFTNTGCFVLSPEFMLAVKDGFTYSPKRTILFYFQNDLENDQTCVLALRENNTKPPTKSMNNVPSVVGQMVLLFDSSMNNASDDEPQPSSDAKKKDDEGVNKESRFPDQEKSENSTQGVNTAGPSINTKPNMFSLGDNATLEATHADLFSDETEVDMRNITTTYQVPSTPNTRIHKDHSLDHVIGDVQSGVKTRRMTKTINKQGFISAVYDGKTYEDLHTCLFACFLSYEEPKKMYRNKKDERGIVIRNKARLVTQGYTQEEGIDYDEVFALRSPVEKKALDVYINQSRASQDKYVDEILKKFGFSTMKTANIPIETSKPLLKDAEAEDVDVHLYRSMIGSLMYLTSSRPDIIFVVCACARFQVTPKVLHLHAVKRIIRYLKGQPKLGPWCPKDSPFDLKAYTDSDYAGASLDRKSTTGGCQFLRSRLMSWQCKKQTIVANSTNEAKYVAVASCFKNPVFHSKTKHIEIRHHFIRDSNEKKLIQMIKIHTDQNVGDLLTKAFDGGNCVNSGEIMQMKLSLNGTTSNDQIQVRVVGLTFYCAKTTAWNEFNSTMASAIICLATNQNFNFSKYIFDNMVKNLEGEVKFLMYPRPITDEAANEEHVPIHSNDPLLSVEVEKVVSTAEVTTASATTTTVDELTLAQTLIEIKAAKPKAVTTAATTTTTALTSQG
ncbi:hypothetical protein Tco_0468174 [Tanacetum coccineum]